MNPWIAVMGELRLTRAVEVSNTSAPPLIEDVRRVAAGDVDFGFWLLQVGSILSARTGLTLFHMEASWPWRSSYDAGDHPGVAAFAALRAHPRLSHLLAGYSEDIEGYTPPEWMGQPG